MFKILCGTEWKQLDEDFIAMKEKQLENCLSLAEEQSAICKMYQTKNVEQKIELI